MNKDMFCSCNRKGGTKHRWQAVKDISSWYAQGIRQSPASCCSFGQLEASPSEKIQNMPSWADPFMKVGIGWGVGPWSLDSKTYNYSESFLPPSALLWSLCTKESSTKRPQGGWQHHFSMSEQTGTQGSRLRTHNTNQLYSKEAGNWCYLPARYLRTVYG